MPNSVLFIEDEEEVLRLSCEHFSSRQFKVFSALNGRDGVRLAQECNPDIVVTDYSLPDWKGDDVLTRINGGNLLRANGATAVPNQPNTFTANATLGLPGQARTIMTYKFQNNHWEVAQGNPPGAFVALITAAPMIQKQLKAH